MYPAHFYGLFPAFPRNKTVFVAMSFDQQFDLRWNEVIEPAIQDIEIDGAPLKAVRVNSRIVGDSILTEILSGIGTAQVILADISSIGTLDDRPVRNGNVMYEIGLAHATRLPEEVLLFRSDREQLLFDTANVRVNNYAPDEDPVAARRQITEAIITALKEVDLRRHLAVQAVVKSLDVPSYTVLLLCTEKGYFDHPRTSTMGEAMGAVSKASAIQRLLTLGLLEMQPKSFTPEESKLASDTPINEIMPYVMTAFGHAVFREMATRSLKNSRPDLFL